MATFGGMNVQDLMPAFTMIAQALNDEREQRDKARALSRRYDDLLRTSTDVALARISAGAEVNAELAATSVTFALQLELEAAAAMPIVATPAPNEQSTEH